MASKVDGLRPWCRSRVGLVLIAPIAVVLGTFIGAFVGALNGAVDACGEIKEAWGILSRARQENRP